MNENLYWGILIVFGGILLTLVWLLRHYLSIRGSLSARSMLNKERMMALSKDMQLPDGDLFPVVPVKVSRLSSAYLAKLVAIPGLVLSFGGIGTGIGFLLSTDDLKKWASLSLIPFFTGVGLLAYLFIARRYFNEVPGANGALSKSADRPNPQGEIAPVPTEKP